MVDVNIALGACPNQECTPRRLLRPQERRREHADRAFTFDRPVDDACPNSAFVYAPLSLQRIPVTYPPGQGEPLNVIISGHSDADVLVDAETDGGLRNYFLCVNRERPKPL